MKRFLSVILLFLIVMEIAFSTVYNLNVIATTSIPPLYVSDAVNAEINQLWSKSPIGIYAFHEAASVNQSFWTDDNAKFLESVAPWWQSYSIYVSNILQFLQQGDVDGLFVKRFEYPLNPVQPVNINGLTGYTNGFYDIVGNPLNGTLSVRTYYNPALAVAYLWGNVVQYPNGILINLEAGTENPILDGSFSGTGGQNPPWESISPVTVTNNSIVQLVNSAKTYLNLTGPSLFAPATEDLQFNLPIVNVLPHYIALYSYNGTLGQYNYKGQFIDFTITLYLQSSSINRVYLLFIWENSTSGTLVLTDMPVYFDADGQWTSVTVSVPSSVYPKYWNLGNTASVPLLVGIGLMVPGSQTGNTYVYVGGIGTIYPTTFGPKFTVEDYGSYAIFNESWYSAYLDATFWIAYILGQGDAIEVLASAPVNGSGIYIGLNELDTIGTGYSIMETPTGVLKNYQNTKNVTWAYLNGNFGNWFLLSTKYAPNWIGGYQMLFIFPMAKSNNPYVNSLGYTVYMGDPMQVRNTIFVGSNVSSPPGYFHWVEIFYANNGNPYGGIFGFFIIPSVDYLVNPNVIVDRLFPSNFTSYDPSTVPNYWWDTVWGEDYYEGQIIYALALLGKYGNSQALAMAEQAWSAYFNQLKQSDGWTYTSSLARFLMATIILYQITGNQQYSNAYTQIADWLLQWQNRSKWAYVYITMWYHRDYAVSTVNGFETYGYIINTTSEMDVGTVISGTEIAVNFFEDIPLNTSYGIYKLTGGSGELPIGYSNTLNVSGNFTTCLYLNGGGTFTYANITVSVQIAYNGNVLQTIGMATYIHVPIFPGGSSGSPPFYLIPITFPLRTTINAPPSSTLIVAIKIQAQSTVYLLVDSTNGPSKVIIPLSWRNPFYGEFTIPPVYSPYQGIRYASLTYYLDVTALAGQALMMLYDVTGNQTYLNAAEIAAKSIHYSEVPTPTYSIGISGAPVTYRLWAYSTYSTVQSDYFTYMDELISQFADAIGNASLASLAISRVWQRSSYNYPMYYYYYVAAYGSGQQINSETQPWGDVATEDYVSTWEPSDLQLFWASLPQEDWIMNQTWNGSALTIYLYSYYGNQFQLWFLTPTTNFNVIINGNYTNYEANHQVLVVSGYARPGSNIIIIVPNPTNQQSLNMGLNSTFSLNSPLTGITGIQLTPQEAELFGFVIYFTFTGLIYLFTRSKTITTLGSLIAVVILWALGLWPIYMVFLIGSISLFILFYSIREGGEDGD